MHLFVGQLLDVWYIKTRIAKIFSHFVLWRFIFDLLSSKHAHTCVNLTWTPGLIAIVDTRRVISKLDLRLAELIEVLLLRIERNVPFHAKVLHLRYFYLTVHLVDIDEGRRHGKLQSLLISLGTFTHSERAWWQHSVRVDRVVAEEASSGSSPILVHAQMALAYRRERSRVFFSILGQLGSIRCTPWGVTGWHQLQQLIRITFIFILAYCHCWIVALCCLRYVHRQHFIAWLILIP